MTEPVQVGRKEAEEMQLPSIGASTDVTLNARLELLQEAAALGKPVRAMLYYTSPEAKGGFEAVGILSFDRDSSQYELKHGDLTTHFSLDRLADFEVLSEIPAVQNGMPWRSAISGHDLSAAIDILKESRETGQPVRLLAHALMSNSRGYAYSEGEVVSVDESETGDPLVWLAGHGTATHIKDIVILRSQGGIPIRLREIESQPLPRMLLPFSDDTKAGHNG